MKKPEDALAEFEDALTRRPQQMYVLRLYVSGVAPRSQRALNNLKRICEEHLAGRYKLEVIDIYQQPQKAVAEQIIAAPTLIKAEPPPVSRLIGTLSNTKAVLFRLGLDGLLNQA
jgi:circadian clock protein KaiB